MYLDIVIISYKSINKLEKCLSSIGRNRKIIIVENSNEFNLREKIEKKFPNCKIIFNNKNLGYGSAANIGFLSNASQFNLLINTDTIINENQIKDIENEILTGGDDFAIASPIYDDLIDFSKNNLFDKNLARSDLESTKNKKRTKVEILKGCSLIINFKKFKKRNIFDDKIFFFWEEIDLCKRVKNDIQNMYVFNNIKIFHGNNNSKNEIIANYEDFREWNYYWSRFYYYKKHYGFLFAMFKHISKIIRFSINLILFYFISKKIYKKNKYRLYGLCNSIIGNESRLSDKILNQ